jgi:hypothetical protein
LDLTDFFATVIGWVLRAVLVLAGLVFFLSLLAAATLLALLGLLRALWARATGQPVAAWRMGIDPRAGFGRVYRSAERWTPPARRRGGVLPGADSVTDVTVREVRKP